MTIACRRSECTYQTCLFDILVAVSSASPCSCALDYHEMRWKVYSHGECRRGAERSDLAVAEGVFDEPSIVNVEASMMEGAATKHASLQLRQLGLRGYVMISVSLKTDAVSVCEQVGQLLRIILAVAKDYSWTLIGETHYDFRDVPVEAAPEAKLAVAVVADKALADHVRRQRHRTI